VKYSAKGNRKSRFLLRREYILCSGFEKGSRIGIAHGGSQLELDSRAARSVNAAEEPLRPSMETRVLLPPSWLELAPLISASREEGYLFLVQLEHEYLSGKVRFEAAGETLLGVFESSVLVGVGGLTRDPDSTIQRTGRVRHVYVLPEYRHRGIGKALLKTIERLAKAHFSTLVLRAGGMAAESFFVRVGYEPVSWVGGFTHRRLLVSFRGRRQPALRDSHAPPRTREDLANGCRCKIIGTVDTQDPPLYGVNKKCPVHG
jgi:GNAT superfamily N-acetyltransferase